jgi:sulfofructose kinase
VYWQGRFHYSPGFVVETVDTTGAGDVFHGAFIFGLVAGWEMNRILDFANAMAALNCTKLGARGGIATVEEAERLMATGSRHVNPAYTAGPHAPPGPRRRRRSAPRAARR